MPFIKRNWTPQEADEWTKEDLIASIISPLAYIAWMLGVALSFLLIKIGFIIIIIAAVLTYLMIYVINPKLSVLSDEYEKKQKNYLEDLEKTIRWEE
ncbi:hypothetical protein ACFL4T_06100 [candidate division KSB1 bacterium]